MTASTEEIPTLIFHIVFCVIRAAYFFFYVGCIILNRNEFFDPVCVVVETQTPYNQL